MLDLRTKLQEKGVRLEDFQAVNAVLISRGVLSRNESARSRVLYHVAQRVEEELFDAMHLMYGASIVHDTQSSHYRLMPFGYADDGVADPGEEMEIRRELRGSMIKDYVVAILTLKTMYDEVVLDRRIEADGRTAVRVTDFLAAMKQQFHTEFPIAESHRQLIFKKLKKHLVADVDIANFKDEDAVIVIRPEITTLVLETALAQSIDIHRGRVPAVDDEPLDDEEHIQDTEEEFAR